MEGKVLIRIRKSRCEDEEGNVVTLPQLVAGIDPKGDDITLIKYRGCDDWVKDYPVIIASKIVNGKIIDMTRSVARDGVYIDESLMKRD